jgi:PKD repeat protein
MPQYIFPLVPGGYLDMLTIGNPIILDTSWDGICNEERPGWDYFYRLNAGQYLQLNLDWDLNDYYIYYISVSNDRQGNNWVADIDYGDLYIIGRDSILMTSWMACSDINGRYSYTLNGDRMTLFNLDDICPERIKYLTDSTFTEQPETGPTFDLAHCPGDRVLFKVAGGVSWEWHFGDGSPVSNEKYPMHVYTSPGDYDAYVVALNSCGRRDTIHTYVKIRQNNPPPPFFGWEGWDFKRLEPIEFNYGFDMLDDAGNFTYLWEFGDGATSSLRNPLHAYQRTGDYNIQLTVTNGCGSSTSTQMIYIRDAILSCEAKIHIDSAVGRTVYFKDISRGEITDRFWDFGDGFTSGEQNPVYTYNHDGIFFACLSIYDSLNDCAHQVCRQVFIGTQECRADFNAKVNAATGRVQFTDMSINSTEWFWDFGDGNFSSGKDPVYTYTESGWYKVCLSAYNADSDCFAHRCKEIFVGAEEEKACFADFSYIVRDDNTVVFTDKSSENVTNWYWVFGDGTVHEWNFLEGVSIENKDPVKKYRGPGIYEVCLIVYDKVNDCADEICMRVPVGVPDCNLRADFTFFINVGNMEVTFSDRSGGKVTDWFWDFGDGGTSTSPNPRHKYERQGFYLVVLSVWDEINGCSDHMPVLLQVGQAECRAGFEYKVDATTRNVQFYNQSKGTLAEYFWSFDDGSHSAEKSPSHQFRRDGIYFVTLTVISETGLCMDIAMEPVQVGEVDCAAKFRYFIDSANNTAYFAPVAIGSATDYLWMFGDGAISTEKEVVHRFAQPGYFTVGLNTFDEATGCMDYYEEVILIGRAGLDCRAGFTYMSDPSTRTVKFGDRSKGKIMDHIWDFGDGTPPVFEQNPSHTFERGGHYLVCLTVVNEFDIPNTFCDFVPVATSDEERCFAEFFYSVDSATRTVEFVQHSHGDPDKFHWNFGDGGSSEEENPAYTYQEKDYYLVELIIANSTTGCESNRFELVNVAEGNRGLKAAFTYSTDSSNLKADTYPTDFVGVSLGDAGKLKWTFGDGGTDTVTMNPTYVYDSAGVYIACLVVSNPITEDVDTFCQEVVTYGYTGIDSRETWKSRLSNYPNPFDNTTTIDYELTGNGWIDLAIFDQTGRMVDILVREEKDAGHYRIEYDGSKLNSGIYTLRLATQKGVYTARMVVR